MSTAGLAAITVQIPLHHVGRLKDMLRERPQLSLFRRGGIFVPVLAIVGPPAAIEAFRPEVERWEADCVSVDAW